YSVYIFFLHYYGYTRVLHSFPTRRSSDLASPRVVGHLGTWAGGQGHFGQLLYHMARYPPIHTWPSGATRWPGVYRWVSGHVVERSEEHTSELQSRGHLVCRLLLEKKKNQK